MNLESLQKLHMDAIEKARQTNLDMDWNDAQSIGQTIKEFQEVRDKSRDLGTRLGILEAFAKTVINVYGGSATCNLLKEMFPELYCELLEGRMNGHLSDRTKNQDSHCKPAGI